MTLEELDMLIAANPSIPSDLLPEAEQWWCYPTHLDPAFPVEPQPKQEPKT